MNESHASHDPLHTAPHDAAGRNRSRRTTGIALGIVLALGFSTRLIPEHLPAFVVQHVGDGLWAVMIYLLLALARPRAKRTTLFVLATAICFAVEASQLYQADWIRDIRALPLAGLVLGYGFQWSDLLAYAAGTTLAALGDPLLQRRS